MSYQLVIVQGDDPDDAGRAIPLATSQGYAALAAWVESLDAGEYPTLAALVADGHAGPVGDLSAELDDAIDDEPPDDADTLHTAEQLADAIGDKDDEDKYCYVTTDAADGGDDA